MKPGTPVVFFDSGTVTGGTPTTAAGSWQPSADKMQNPYGLPVELTELRLQATIDPFQDDSGVTIDTRGLNPLALLRMKLTLDNSPITNGYITPQMSGYFDNRLGYIWFNRDISLVAGAQNKVHAFFRWKFPRPTYLQEGAAFLSDFFWQTPSGGFQCRTAFSNNASVVVKMAVIGKLVDSVPDQFPVPYVTQFTGLKSGGLDSKDTELMNICSVPLNVSGLVGRVFAGGVAAQDNEGWVDENWPGAPGNYLTSWTTKRFKLVDSHDSSLIRFYTPFSTVFGPRFWLPCSQIMKPRDWLRVTLETQASADFIPAISLVGWRNERRR